MEKQKYNRFEIDGTEIFVEKTIETTRGILRLKLCGVWFLREIIVEGVRMM